MHKSGGGYGCLQLFFASDHDRTGLAYAWYRRTVPCTMKASYNPCSSCVLRFDGANMSDFTLESCSANYTIHTNKRSVVWQALCNRAVRAFSFTSE